MDDQIVRDHLDSQDNISTAHVPAQRECNDFHADDSASRQSSKNDVTGAVFSSISNSSLVNGALCA